MEYKAHRQDQLRERIDEILKNRKIDQSFISNKTMEEIFQEICIYHQELEHQNQELLRIREELEKSRAHFYSLFNDAPLGYVIYDQEYNIISTNVAYNQMVDMSEQEVKKLSLRHFIHPDSQDTFYFHIRNLMQKKLSQSVQILLKGRNNQIPVKIESNLLNEGTTIYIRSAIIDLVKEKEMEEALIASERKIRNVIESLAHPFYVINAENYSLTLANSATKKLSGEAKLTTCYALSYKRKVPCTTNSCPLEIVVKTKKPVVLEHRHLDGNGNPIFHEVHGYPLFDDSGNVVEMITYTLDITQRKQIEENLIKREELLAQTQQLTKIGGWEWNIESQTSFWTKEVYRIHGYLPGELVLSSEDHILKSVQCFDPEDQPVILEAFNKCIEEGIPYDLEFPFNTVDGRRIWVRTTAQPILENSKIIKVIGYIMDITERKETERKLTQYTKELEIKSLEMEELYRKLGEEIEKARHIHQMTLPDNLPDIEGLSFAAYYCPAYKLGGDYYDVVKIKNKLVFYIADVSGHSLDGAMMSIFVKNTISNYLNLVSEEDITPYKVIEYVFKQYSKERYPEDYFVCLFIGVLDTTSKELTYSGTGFHFPFIAYIDNKLHELLAGGLPISSIYDFKALDIKEEKILLSHQSTILIYTDGLIEEERNGEQYGIERIEKLLAKTYFMPPDLIRDIINDDYHSFAGSYQGEDDITYLILRVVQEKLRCSFSICSNKTEPSEAIDKLEDIIGNMIEDKEILLMGLYEIIVNAAEHGNKLKEDKKVQIDMSITNSYILFSVSDEGPGFPWKEKLFKEYNPLSLDERGRGIGITRLCFDYMTYNLLGNKVSLVKYLKD